MARSKVILQSEFPYHVNARCINREWFNLPMDLVWDIMCRQLNYIWYVHDARILAFVLMSNHWHLKLRTPNSNVSQILHHFMRETSRELTYAGNRINQTYGGRNFKTIIDSERYFGHAYKYIYLNPVKAGLAARPEDYPYSSLYGLLGKARQPFPVEEDTKLFDDVEGTLHWLNKMPSEENWKTVGQALRRKKFWLPKCNKKIHPLEMDIF